MPEDQGKTTGQPAPAAGQASAASLAGASGQTLAGAASAPTAPPVDLTAERKAAAALTAKFSFLADKVRVQRPRRLWADVPAEHFTAVFEYATKEAGFVVLCTITGLDLGTSFGAIYHVAREDGMVLNLCTSVPKDTPVLATVTGQFPAAEMYEREMMDLLGMRIEGLPEGARYPLPDTWPAGQYPLRKDWTVDMLPGGAGLNPATPAGAAVPPMEAKNE
jgi:Ni,Fe-hydrogenase III component G